MFVVACALIALSMVLVVIVALRGPSVIDRLLAANSIGTLCMLLLVAMLPSISGRRTSNREDHIPTSLHPKPPAGSTATRSAFSIMP